MKVLIYGAGVIGQIYGGRLAAAGHDVTILARGRTLEALTSSGITIRCGAETCNVRPRVVGAVARDTRYDVALVTVRRDQVDELLPAVADLVADRVVFMVNLPVDLDSVSRRVGVQRTIFAFPGVGGHRNDDGTISYLEVPQQHTTVGRSGGLGQSLEQPVVDLLRSAGFAVDVSDDIEGWLKTHAVFVTAVSAAVLACGGDSVALAADRKRVATMVSAVGEGFDALARQGVTVTPRPLRLIFTVVPRFIAVWYWRKQLRGPVGTVTIAPHARASRDTEFPQLCADVRSLIAGDGAQPHLDRLLESVA